MTFDEDFWPGWPNKVAKKDARRAWDKAIAAGVDPQVIIEGRDRYKRGKPDWKAWMHPATFINGERYEDEYEEQQHDFGVPDYRESKRIVDEVRRRIDETPSRNRPRLVK